MTVCNCEPRKCPGHWSRGNDEQLKAAGTFLDRGASGSGACGSGRGEHGWGSFSASRLFPGAEILLIPEDSKRGNFINQYEEDRESVS